MYSFVRVSPFNASPSTPTQPSYILFSKERNGYLSFSSLFFPDSKINYLVFYLSPSSIEASGKLPLEKNFPTIPRCRNSVFTTGDENGNLLGKSARLLLRSRETKSEKYFREMGNGGQAIIPRASCIAAAHAIDSSS